MLQPPQAVKLPPHVMHKPPLASSSWPKLPTQSKHGTNTDIHALGNIFSFPHHQTWEFTSSNPVRSVFPLWIVYGLPMLTLKGIWLELGKELAPEFTYYTLRVLMFILSFVLEDWAIHELVQSPRHRRLAVTLVASSYVTWTYQTHTFSNSIETLAVLWSLVMIQRILDDKVQSTTLPSLSIHADKSRPGPLSFPPRS